MYCLIESTVLIVRWAMADSMLHIMSLFGGMTGMIMKLDPLASAVSVIVSVLWLYSGA